MLSAYIKAALACLFITTKLAFLASVMKWTDYLPFYASVFGEDEQETLFDDVSRITNIFNPHEAMSEEPAPMFSFKDSYNKALEDIHRLQEPENVQSAVNWLHLRLSLAPFLSMLMVFIFVAFSKLLFRLGGRLIRTGITLIRQSVKSSDSSEHQNVVAPSATPGNEHDVAQVDDMKFKIQVAKRLELIENYIMQRLTPKQENATGAKKFIDKQVRLMDGMQSRLGHILDSINHLLQDATVTPPASGQQRHFLEGDTAVINSK